MVESDCGYQPTESTSNSTGKPTRKRRLAHRRKYANKSCIKSSSTTLPGSQFIRYDFSCSGELPNGEGRNVDYNNGDDDDRDRDNTKQLPRQPPSGQDATQWTRFDSDESLPGASSTGTLRARAQLNQRAIDQVPLGFVSYSSSSLDSSSLDTSGQTASSSLAMVARSLGSLTSQPVQSSSSSRVDQKLKHKQQQQVEYELNKCIDNVHFNDLFHGSVNDSSSVTINQSVRVFTTAEDVLEALKSVHYNCDRYFQQGNQSDLRGSLSDTSFTNATISNTANNNNSEQYHASHDISRGSSAKPNSTSSVSISDKNGEVSKANVHAPQRPNVPARLATGADLTTGSPSQPGVSKFLLTPNNSNQKRRSTISALTPITGSSASSLVNLVSISNKLGSAELSGGNLDGSCHSKVDQLLSSPSHESRSSSLTIKSDKVKMKTQPTEMKDRIRSSSITCPRASTISPDASVCLHVPAGRQVRTSSLSHTIGTRLAGEECNSNDDSVAFQITLDAPTIDTRASSNDELSHDQQIPNVPPTTPVELTANLEHSNESCDLNCDKMYTKGTHKRTSQSSEAKHLKVKQDKGDSLVDQRKSESGKHNSLAAATILSSFDSGSCDANSMPSSPSELDPTRSSSSVDSARNKINSLKVCRQASSDQTRKPNLVDVQGSKDYKLNRGSSRTCRASFDEIMQMRVSNMKGIDIAESKGAYYDTSADEDKLSSSSNSDLKNDTDSDEQGHQHRDNKYRNNNNHYDEDDVSFRILSKLNKVNLATEANSDRVNSDQSSDLEVAVVAKAKDTDTGEQPHATSHEMIPAEEQIETSPSGGTTKPMTDPVETNETGSQVSLEQATLAESSGQGNVNLTGRTGSVATDTKLPTFDSLRSRVSAVSQQVLGPQTVSSCVTTPRSSFQHHQSDFSGAVDRTSKAGVVVSSSSPRVSSRRSSTASSASAFAAATAASNNPILTQPPPAVRAAGTDAEQDLELASQVDAIHCSCFSGSHRGSLASQSIHTHLPYANKTAPRVYQTKATGSDATTNRANSAGNYQQFAQLPHYPSCVYYHHSASPSNTPSAIYPNAQGSEASSLCTSRTSSRLSSCAGLDYNSSHTTSAQATSNNQALNQQQQQQQQVQGTTSRSSQGQISRGTPVSATLSRSPANRSKRNSTQINIRSVATIRVLSVLRHWVSKHSQDFVNDAKLSYMVQEFLQDLIVDPSLLPAEHKAAVQLQQMVQKAAHARASQVDLDLLLAVPLKPSPDSIETLSALEIAEGMTYLDHKIFLAIRSEEFLGQAWMKVDKAIKAPHILLITKRFNDVSRLVSSEIIRVPELQRRVAVIEKWTNVAHICRVVHNFNGVLQICAAFTNSAVFRLKKTWDKIPKTTKATIDQLQNLVSTDSRFRNMRDAINRCDPPSIPYVGMYLTDLSFIEEGTPNYSPDGLLNFSKMRMIAHVIREIQHLQNGCYKIELNRRVANYLLDSSRHLQDDEMYRCSLAIEPRSSGGKNGVHILNSVSSQATSNQMSQASQSKLSYNVQNK